MQLEKLTETTRKQQESLGGNPTDLHRLIRNLTLDTASSLDTFWWVICCLRSSKSSRSSRGSLLVNSPQRWVAMWRCLR